MPLRQMISLETGLFLALPTTKSGRGFYGNPILISPRRLIFVPSSDQGSRRSQLGQPSHSQRQRRRKVAYYSCKAIAISLPILGKKTRSLPCLGQEVQQVLKRKCRLNSNSRQASMVEEEDDYPVFQVFMVSASQSSDSNFVTLNVASGNFVRFEIDTGARCNVSPVHIYKKATGDYSLKDITPVKSSILFYVGGSIPLRSK